MSKPKRVEMSPEETEALTKRLENHSLTEDDYEKLMVILDTFIYLGHAVDNKNVSIKKLLKMIFGSSTESTKNLLKKIGGESNGGASGGLTDNNRTDNGSDKKAKGHGRNGADAYTGADRVKVPNTCLKSGDPCPLCPKGKVYEIRVPKKVICFKGQPPVHATVYEIEGLRCNLCGEIFYADIPEEASEKRRDETAGSMIALLKYGSGFPFNRLEALQGSLGIPLPSSTQWDVVEGVADRIYPAFEQMKKEAAQGNVIYNDDTTMKILSLMKDNEDKHDKENKRTGTFTTGILSTIEDRKIGLFFTGQQHAGENMTDLLQMRRSDLSPPIQMCDALSRNLPEGFKTILANCMSHGRRNFADIISNFPEECRYVIETIADVYKNDAIAKDNNMTTKERLNFHQSRSRPFMDDLKIWMHDQINDKKVEPNSGLGKAFSYMLNHWEPLTLFLRVAGAPIDNNICEQALKKAILHRKNALFYKTEHGAYVGDMFMSLIHTCNLNKVNPFDYLTELQKHSSYVRK
ncbi:MAG: IS66 family transposase, partial [Gammaproteobacteria bacterium]|nr:IS66 family transposase [Gammaproteobacteria bacterium]